MRLKQLEIKGFKSFANETVINFNEDVIGIVGPNGSGKSNIVDAIRWVLGEQKSRELRLDQMSSVIFNGTRRRKAGGLASVSLTFENTKNLLPTEYHTVTITRMLYRSGESEYRLNGVPCRLRDITSLFLDTGIGSNSYAIIALGMVDDILSDKDNSRRRMFEQAAGISKYKVRKRETLNKLKNTSDDLERVEDLLFEISNNLKSLEKQAKRTKRYFELKAKYKDYSTDLAILKISTLKERQNELRRKLDAEEDRYRQYEVEISKLESALERERKENLDKEKALSDRQRELNNLVGNLRGMENDKRMNQQKQQFLEENQSKLTEDIRNTKARIRQLEEDIDYYRSQLNQEKRLEAGLEEGLAAAEQRLAAIRQSHGALKAGLDEVVAKQQALEREAFELEKQKAINTNQAESNQNSLQRYRQEIEQRRGEVGGLRGKMDALEAEERQKAEALANLERAEEERQERLQHAEAALEELTKKMTRVNREMDAKRNEYKLTKSMVENLEGFPESIRFLSTTKSSEWDKDTPLLSDLIYVKEEYRVAIENYLEPYLNYYVVRNMEAAYRAIQLLSKTQKGKANFFLLDAFQDYVAPMALLPETTRAIELVETDPAYRNLCSYLLEKVLLTEKEEIQGQVPDGDFVLLSKSGRYIQRRYSVSGGSIGLFEGKKIGRKKNLEVLDNAIKKLEREENRLSTEFYSLKSKIEGLKAQRTPAEIQQEQNQLNRLMQEKAALSTRLENFEAFIQEADDKRAVIEKTINKLDEANAGIETALKEKNREIAAIKEKIANTDVNYRQVAEELSQASSAFNDKNIEFVRQQNKVSSFQRELSFREKQLEEARTAVAANQKKLEGAGEEIKAIQDAVDVLEQQLQEAYAQRKEKESLLTEAEQRYFQARGGINELEDSLRKQNKQRQDAQVLVNNLKDKANDLKFEVSSVAQRLRIEFNIDINEIINQEAQTDVPQEELEMKVERLRGRLENYGEINPMAVEAYDEMNERFESITRQRDDILQAKKDLEETIREIEETATVQFLEAFEKARLYFIDVFRSLFTEDDACDLLLLDPDDPLESRIEIVAKPKGKRPQTINQLSGGEKTLTATALLFALYLLKPAPFCIFDEVDAPLDDANIEKFNRIIKKFSKDSQFIIVTHNKLTMAAVDTIYGVYMAEQGVSGVSPVDFRDFEHTASFEVVEN
ncbi:MAG: chromosome segregation protein SMC [Phaeodactylibacter sp.]|nr:chromosome segregation protein SMC [Phaeodactylibacter sp.]